MSLRNEILDLVPEPHFITQTMQVGDEERPPLAQRDTRRVVITLRRRVVGPFINRQDNEGDTIRLRIGDVDHVRVPARKWKSSEKIRGLQICRAYGLVSPDYLYNEVANVDLVANPVSVLFGDSVPGSNDSAGIPSLVVYEQGVSVQLVAKATERLTHNALSEAGLMWNVGEEKGFRSSLFDTLYVKEGTDFLQSITLDAPTPEALAFVLMTLDAARYGAGKQVLGTNVRNEVIGLLATTSEPPVTPYTVLKQMGADNPEKAVEQYLLDLRQWGGHFVPGAQMENLRSKLRGDAEGRHELLNRLAEEAKAYHRFVYGARPKKGRRSERGKSAAGDAP